MNTLYLLIPFNNGARNWLLRIDLSCCDDIYTHMFSGKSTESQIGPERREFIKENKKVRKKICARQRKRSRKKKVVFFFSWCFLGRKHVLLFFFINSHLRHTWTCAPHRGGYRGGGNGPFAPPGEFGKEKPTGTNIGKSPITDNH